MPVWRVSEPFINLWIDDEPLGYQPSRGPRVSFKLAYQQRATIGTNTTLFSAGLNWSFSWFSYLEQPYPLSGDNFLVHFPGGGSREVGPYVPDYLTRTRLEMVVTNNTTNAYKVFYSDGGLDIYDFIVTNSSGAFQKAFLTQRIDPAGNTNRLEYYGYDPSAPIVRLKYLVDVDSRTNAIYYVTNNSFSTNLISHVVDGWGRTNTLRYDDQGFLTNIVDVAGLSSSLAYNTNQWITNLTTPYGATSFSYTTGSDWEGLVFPNKRSVTVTEPNGAKHFYLYRDTLEPAFPSTDVPSTTNGNFALANTFDTISLWDQNTFYWNPRQYDQLSTNYTYTGALDNLTTNDYLRAHLKHWLKLSHAPHLSPTISMERTPSPDGITEGQKTWYDYEGKSAPDYVDTIGTQNLPLYVAMVLPDGTSRFTRMLRNGAGNVTNEITTYTLPNGTVQARTNVYVYAGNEIDLLATVGPDGVHEFGYAYNGNHQVTFTTNALNELTSYTYDSTTKLLTSVKTPAGLTTTNLFDGSNRLVKTIDLEINRTNTFTYANGLVLTHSDERGLTTTNAYDALQRLVAVYFPDGTYTSNQYSRLDLVGTRDRLGNWTTFAYNSIRQRTAVTNALGKVTLYNYCNCGALDSTVDALNNTTYFYYDKAGRQIVTVFADSSWVTNNYNRLGQVTNLLQSPSLSVTNWYNNQGLLTASSNAFGRIQSLAYDIEDRVTNTMDANGVSIGLTLDVLGRVTSRTYPDSGVERFAYSAKGLVAYTNQLSKVTQYVYDEARRKTAETNANLEVTQFKYDASGSLTNLIDGKNQTTTWKYDEFGRVTNKLDHNSLIIFRYKYDAASRLTNRWSVAKGDTYYSYDTVGNLTFVNYPASPDITLSYDALNRVSNMVDAVGTTGYSYDSMGQLLNEDGPWENDTVSYTYANRLRSGLSLSQPNASAWTQPYAYDAIRRLTGITSSAGSFSYGYHSGLGGITAASSLVKSLTYPGGAIDTNQFDSVGRVTEMRLRTSGGTLLNEHDYVYNSGNQRTKQTRTSGDYADYTYDDIGQLKSALGYESGGTTNRWQERFFYGYDKAGNLSNRVQNVQTNVFNVDSLNQLTSVVRTNNSSTVAGATTIAATSVTVADNGNTPVAAIRYADRTFARTNVTLLNGNNTFIAVATDSLSRGDTNTVTVNLPVAVTFLYDQNGNMRTNGTRIFEYDDENQLTRITEPNIWKSEFTYDGKMRMRISKDYAWVAGAWVQTNEVRRVYDGMLVLQERDSFNIPKLTYTRGKDLSGSLEGAGGIGGLLALSQDSSTPSPHLYFHSDGNGNVTSLVDTNQNVAARYLYDPFGNTLSAIGPKAAVNKYRFSSKESQGPSGLVYYGYRWYVPELQRWLNRDLVAEKGGFNLYGFVRNNPLTLRDKLGLSPCTDDAKDTLKLCLSLGKCALNKALSAIDDAEGNCKAEAPTELFARIAWLKMCDASASISKDLAFSAAVGWAAGCYSAYAATMLACGLSSLCPPIC